MSGICAPASAVTSTPGEPAASITTSVHPPGSTSQSSVTVPVPSALAVQKVCPSGAAGVSSPIDSV